MIMELDNDESAQRLLANNNVASGYYTLPIL